MRKLKCLIAILLVMVCVSGLFADGANSQSDIDKYKTEAADYEKDDQFEEAAKCRAAIVQWYEAHTPDDFETRAIAVNRWAWCLDQMEKYEDAIAAWEKAVTLFEKCEVTDAKVQERIADVYADMADAFSKLERYEDSIAYKKKAIDIQKKIGNQDSTLLQFYLYDIAHSYYAMGNMEQTMQYVDAVLTSEVSPDGEPNYICIDAYNLKADVLAGRGDIEAAAAVYKKNIAFIQQYVAEDSIYLLHTYSSLVNFYYSSGDYALAIEYTKKSIVCAISNYGENDARLVQYYTNMTILCEETGNYDEALLYYQKRLAFVQDDSESLLGLYVQMADILSMQKKNADAIPLRKKCMELHSTLPFATEESQTENRIYLNSRLADDLYSVNEYVESIGYYKEALDIALSAGEEYSSSVFTLCNSLASAYYQIKDYNSALDYGLKSDSIAKQDPESYKDTIESRCNLLGKICSESGDYARAVDFFMRVVAVRESLDPQNKSDTDIWKDFFLYQDVTIAYQRIGDFQNALVYGTKMKDSFLLKAPADHLYAPMIYNRMGSIHIELKNYEIALDYYQKVLSIQKAHYEECRADMVSTYQTLGFIYTKLLRPDDVAKCSIEEKRLREELTK